MPSSDARKAAEAGYQRMRKKESADYNLDRALSSDGPAGRAPAIEKNS
jgi:hypothetical protein